MTKTLAATPSSRALTTAEALSLIADRERIHTFLTDEDRLCALSGADMDRPALTQIILNSRNIELSADARAVALDHRLKVKALDGSVLWLNVHLSSETRAEGLPNISDLGWRCSKTGEHWPKLGDDYLVRLRGKGAAQRLTFDQGDDDYGGGEYFWDAGDAPEHPTFCSDTDLWKPDPKTRRRA